MRNLIKTFCILLAIAVMALPSSANTVLQGVRLQGTRISSSTIPVGAIGWWGSTVAEIPSTLLQCNGVTTSGVTPPDLRNKFVIGAGNLYTVGQTLGAATHTHTFYGGGGGVLNSGNEIINSAPSGYYAYNIGITVTSHTSSAGNNVPPYFSAPYVYHAALSGVAPLEVVGWTGLISDIPARFSLANGQTVNGITTPDWRDKFIVGTGSSYAEGTTGGAATHPHPPYSIGLFSGDMGRGSVIAAAGTPPNSLSRFWSGSGSGSAASVASLPPYYELVFIQNTSGIILPVSKGMVVVWANSIASIPSDWTINNNLKDKIPVGAKQDSGGVAKTNVSGSLTQTGGATTHNSTPSFTGTWGIAGSGLILISTPSGTIAQSGVWNGSGAPNSGTNLPPSVAYAYITKT